MWKIEVLKYGNRNLASEDNVTFYQRPHNDYLWVLSEQGIIGFIFYFLSLLLILKYLFDLIRKSNDKTEYFFLILILFSYVGYLSFSFFAFPNERIEHQVFLAIIFSFILVKTDKNSITNNKTQNLVLFIIISITVFSSIFIGYHRVKSEYYLKKAFEARYTKSWNKEIKYLNKSESYFYKIDPFSTPLSWYRGEAYFNLNNLEKAYTDFKNAYKINPNHIHVLNNLATCYVLKGENNEAKELYKKAIELSPTFKEAILNITAVYFNQNQIDSAIFYLTKYKGPSSDEKYKNYLLTVLKSKINKIKESCSDALIINILEKILLNNEWIVNIFEKSKEKNINFENQILKDAIYTLENIDNKISKEESKLLLSKYNL
jgi:tetratricopeptide (TPR) repeat protein